MIDALAQFHFVRPLWLVLLLPAFGLWLVERRAADASARWRSVIDAELLKHLLVDAGERRVVTPNIVLLLAWTLGTIAVAGPTWEREPSPFADAKPAVLVLLKVTPSMQAQDLAPTRLDRARQKLSDLLGRREGAATGLVAYAGSPHLVLPPTSDRDVVFAMAQALSPRIMPKEGDDLAGAMALAQRVLRGNGQGGSILILADGIAPDQLSRLAESDVPVTFLGMAPREILGADSATGEALSKLGADEVAATVDQSDVAGIASRLDRVGQPRDIAGEGEHWKEAGIWLVPFLALVTLLWFRRGWVLG